MPSAVIAGAGVFGASVAHRLTLSGWKVTIVDPYPPGHVRAASGHERLIRFAHGGDRWYVRSRRARELWRDLEAETGRELMIECGVAWFALREDGWEAQSEEVLRAEDVPAVRLGLDDAAAPSELRRRGARVRSVRARGRDPAGPRRGPRVDGRDPCGRGSTAPGVARPEGDAVLVDGERLAADRVIWACGAWLAAIFPGSSTCG